MNISFEKMDNEITGTVDEKENRNSSEWSDPAEDLSTSPRSYLKQIRMSFSPTKRKSSTGLVRSKGVVYRPDGSVDTCMFCQIAAGLHRTEDLLYEDENIAAFIPRDRASKTHFLIVPKQHITNISHLTNEDLRLLQHMRTVGETLLERFSDHVVHLQKPVGNSHGRRFVFHVPPFNSIDHLHVHCISAPFDSMYSKMKYSVGTPWCRSLSSVMERLSVAHKP